jgi:phosphoribosylaminoimidazolecarboxamide formyltransferase / IMP cyclohydrolase
MSQDRIPIRRAVLSVHNKQGIVELARALRGWSVEILSTGGTARLLQDNQIPVTPIEKLTGFAEMLDGRVKTLHPAVHGGILANRSLPAHMEQLSKAGIVPIDLVVVNLYPFEQAVSKPDCTLAGAIEEIDIGGPCMLRASAKNHDSVLAWCEPTYEALLAELKEQDGGSRLAFRRHCAARVFARTSCYDALIAQYLARSDASVQDDPLPDLLPVPLRKTRSLRYGENPHQQAALYEQITPGPVSNEANLLRHAPEGGKEMSVNNYYDANAALELIKDITFYQPHQTACVLVKHNNPCGVAVASDPLEAYCRAYRVDPVATMGGVLAINRPVTRSLAEGVMNSLDRWGREAGARAFLLEVWLAPEFEQEALDYIRQAKPWGRDLRCIATGPMHYPRLADEKDFRRITGGMLVQQRDLVGLDEEEWVTVTKRPPNAQELSDGQLAWLVAKHTRSNAIVLVRDAQVLAVGAGQASRVAACKLAVHMAGENGHGPRLAGAVAASDGYFPFKDGPQVLLQAGIRMIIQPGGSKRDDETLHACDAADAVMILTSRRHFKH